MRVLPRTGYDDQLDRALSTSLDIAEDDDRFSVPESTVRQEGNVTTYGDFAVAHDRLTREATYILRFFRTELDTSAQIDDRGRARFTDGFR